MKISPENLFQYCKLHEKVLPEIQEAIALSGMHNYSLFYRPDGFIIGYYETKNISHQESCEQLTKFDAYNCWKEEISRYTSKNVQPDDMVTLNPYFYLGNDIQLVE